MRKANNSILSYLHSANVLQLTLNIEEYITFRSPISWDEDLRSSLGIFRVSKSRIMRWAGNLSLMGESRGLYRVSVGKPEGNRPIGRPRRR